MMMLALSDYIVYHGKKDVKGRWSVLSMEKKNLSQQTMERLYNTIVAEKRMQPGDKLPNELELSDQLGVSRATLREALRMLIARGVLEVRRGKGTFVSERVEEIEDFGFSDVGQLRGQLRDLFELREIFEPGAARLACRRATEEELEEILQCGAAVERCIMMGEDRTKADRDFHAAIVRATHNEFMMRLLPLIGRAVAAAVAAGEHGEELAEDTVRDHALMMEFFRRRDEAGAEHAMAIHLRHGACVLGITEAAAGED